MSRSSKLNLMLWVVLVCHSHATLAFTSVSQYADNCFVFNQTSLRDASNIAVEPTGFTLPAPDNSPLLPGCQQTISPTRYQQTNKAQNGFITPLPTWFERIEQTDLPIPASLVFVMLWLIGFKLTRQPEPMLNRAQAPLSGKDFIVMSLSNNKQPSSY